MDDLDKLVQFWIEKIEKGPSFAYLRCTEIIGQLIDRLVGTYASKIQ